MVKKYKRQVVTLYNSECYICKKKYGKRFSFHHYTYKKDEKTYRDFKNNDNYQEYILPIIQNRPYDFELLCHKHHYIVEKLKRFKPENLERLISVVRSSV